tara:strand:+ start:113 stop:505 length:393 start_codon:yes stop_codon:yes gene_type:complete
MKDQLFKNKPDMNLVNDTIRLFGLSDFNDNTLFTKQNMVDLKTVQKVNEIIPRLQDYYLPCKSKKYLTRLDEKRCLTILRQLLKQYNYNLLTKEKCIKGEKFNYYQIIQYSNKKINTKQIEERKIVLSFD